MQKSRTLTLVVPSFLLSFAALSHAAMDTDLSSVYVGAMPGLGLVSNGGGSNFTLAGTVGARLNEQIGAGVYVSHTKFDTGSGIALPTGSTVENGGHTIVAGEGNYFFMDRLNGLYAGGKVGIGINSPAEINVPGLPSPDVSNSTDFVLGPHAGYDYHVSNNMTIGGQINVLFTTQSGGATDTNFLAALKFFP